MDLLLEGGRIETKQTEQRIRSTFSRYNDPLITFEALGRSHETRKEQQKISSTNYRKHHGIYYTPYNVAKRLIDDLLDLEEAKLSLTSTFLDPCAGHGIFIIAYIDAMVKRLSLKADEDFQQLLDNIYYADNDAEAIELLKAGVPAYVEEKYNVSVSLKKSNSFIGNTLFSATKDGLQKNDLKQIFGQPVGFSIIATNPPYKLLKATTKHYDGEDGENHRDNMREIISFLKSENYYPLNEGTLNLYKLFCEEILSNLSSSTGLIGLLIPQTLLNDKQSTKLRKAILKYKLSTIFILPESNRFFSDITQSFCLFGLKKQIDDNSLSVVSPTNKLKDFNKIPTQIEKALLATISDSMPVVALDKKAWKILEKIHNFPHLKDAPQLRNLRGELDLTLNKSAVTGNATKWPLLRGSNVKLFSHTSSPDFVIEEFALRNPKNQYSQGSRIACQQISNISSKKRLKFSWIEPNVILGNSCNFIAIDNNSIWRAGEFSLKYLLGVLNSNILEWRFRLTSSNNHVGNHELGNLPIPVPTKAQRLRVEKLVDLTLEDQSDYNISMLNAYVAKLYGLGPVEFDFIQEQTIDSVNQGSLL